MEVETFEVLERETGEQAPEMEAEAIEIIEALGLTGQQGLIVEPGEAEVAVKTRIPYRKIKADEEAIYKVLCPSSCLIEEYEAGPIPLRVLQVAAHAKELDFFNEGLHVCYAPDVQTKDPLLVGHRKSIPAGTTWARTETFILARWGDVLLSMEELYELAKEKWMETTKGACVKVKAETDILLASLEAAAIRHLAGEHVHIPY